MTMINQDRLPEENLTLLSLLMGLVVGSVAAVVLVFLLVVIGPLISPEAIVASVSPLLPGGWYEVLQQQASLMGFPLQAESKAFWYMARISGLLSYLFIWGSTVWGLMLSSKVVKSWVSPALTLSVHEYLSWLGLGFGLFHALILLGDRYINFSLVHILVPFSAPFEPLWVGVGTLGLYLYGLLLGSFYIRKQIGHRIWRLFHYLSFLLYLKVVVHSIMIGSDNGLFLTQVMYLWSSALVLFLIFYRILAKR